MTCVTQCVETIINTYKPCSQEQIRRILWKVYDEACTQQAVSYHCRKLGAVRDDGGFWYIPMTKEGT